MANTIYRGTTPVISITLSDTIDLTEMEVIYLTFSINGSILLEKNVDDMTIGDSNNVAIFKLSQTETLSFTDGSIVDYQLRMRDGENAYATKPLRFSVGGILKAGEI